MKKLVAPMIAAAFTASTLLMPVSSVSAYDNGHSQGPNGNYNNGSYGKPETGNGQQNGGDYADKGAQKQLLSIDKQLTKVEELIAKYDGKFDKMENKRDKDEAKDKDKNKDKEKDKNQGKDSGKDNSQDAESPAKQPALPDASTEDNQQPVSPLTTKAPTSDDSLNDQQTSDKEQAKKDKEQEKAEKEQAKKDKEQAEKEKEAAEEAAEKEKEAAEEAKEREEDLAEELEEAVEEYNDYTGKFTSLSYRLDGIGRQLDSLSTRITDTSLLTPRYEKIEQLRGQLTASADKINTIQQTVVDKITAEKDAEVKPEAPVSDVMKPWTIKFSKPLDEQAISELNAVVVDSRNNLIATTTTYDAASRALIITPLQAYKTGEKYTLFIDKEIKSHSGKTLKKSIKKTFYIH